ncbi:MAG: glycosyltransferase family 8 protein [Xenococcaceae cyanobacterium]
MKSRLKNASENELLAVVCAADNRYAMPLCVMLYSLIENLKSNQKIVLFVIDGGIKWLNKRKIMKSLVREKGELEIQWLESRTSEMLALLENVKVSDYVTIATYYRLLIPYLLPDDLSKVIYLDSDLVLREDLRKLWDMDLEDNYLLAVQDMGAPYVSSRYGLATYKELGIPSDYKYFNAGVLVINLEKWRTDNITVKVIEYLEKYRERVRWWDQDGLNAILAGKWGELDPRWNQTPHIHRFQSWRESPFTENMYRNIVNAPYIIHFATGNKPWNFKINYKPTEKLFFQYLDRTLWSGWRPRESFNSKLNRYWRKFLRKITGQKC